MGNIDRIINLPILTLAFPQKKVIHKHRGEGEITIKPLRWNKSLSSPYATGCDKWNDCLTCPDELASKCPLGK